MGSGLPSPGPDRLGWLLQRSQVRVLQLRVVWSLCIFSVSVSTSGTCTYMYTHLLSACIFCMSVSNQAIYPYMHTLTLH